MDKTIGVSEHVYEVLEELKEELDHTSFDSALRDALNRAGLSDEGQDFTTITDYELGHYTEWVEGQENVKKINHETMDNPQYQNTITGHKTYGPVPNELEMYGYVRGFRDGKSHGITYAWPRRGIMNYTVPMNHQSSECASCGTSLVRSPGQFTAEFYDGTWSLEEDSVCSDCDLEFPTSDENPQVVMRSYVRRTQKEDDPLDYVHSDLEIVRRHYPDEQAEYWK